jgi:hypothetical protein
VEQGHLRALAPAHDHGGDLEGWPVDRLVAEHRDEDPRVVELDRALLTAPEEIHVFLSYG